MDISHGSILIDGIDLSAVPRNAVRSRINCVSQDSYFLTGSVRLNLDPYATADDASLVIALKKVKLWHHIESLGGLDADLDVETLSHGQRQLLSMARATLHPSKIVVLDEVTSRYVCLRTHFLSTSHFVSNCPC